MASVHGLDKLHQALIEALELEKCCICLEKLQNCVILWPCSHRFCNDCVLAYLVSVHGDKIPCPLCKRSTTRRSILNFQDRQQEFEDSLQTLIGNISLDLGFDITSFQPFQKTKVTSDNNNKIRVSSPVRKTRCKTSRNIYDEQKTNQINCGDKRLTESPVNSGNLKSHNVSPRVVKLNDVIKNISPNNEKVNQWLTDTHFSQGESPIITNTVVADVHKSDLESPVFSDDQLVSVSQVESKTIKESYKKKHKSLNVSSDINAIKPFDETYKCHKKSSQKKSNEKSYQSEKFDQLLCPEKKYQIISETYQGRNSRGRACKRGRRFGIDVNLFKPDEKNTEKGKMSDCDKLEDSSEKSSEDFSSGSGEEWAVEEKSNKDFSSKNKILKNIKKLTKSKNKRNGSEGKVLKRANKNNIKITKNKNVETLLTNNKCLLNFLNENTENDKLNKGKRNSFVNNYNKTENDSTKSNETVKRIHDDWNDYKDTNNVNTPFCNEDQSRNVSTHVQPNTSVELTPVKQDNQRSPGWSRLKNTKREFHMSERKKLSLKTLSKSVSNSTISTNKTSTLNRENKSFDGLNQSFDDNKGNNVSNPLISQCKELLNKVEKQDVVLNQLLDVKEQTTTISSTVEQKVLKINNDVSKSFSSDSDSPCMGFTSQEKNKSDLKKLKILNVGKCGEAPTTNKKTVPSEKIHSQIELSTGSISQENLENYLHNADSKNSYMEVDMEQDLCIDKLEVRSPKISEERNYVTDKKLELQVNSSCGNSSGKTESKIVCVNNEQINSQHIKMMKRDRDPDLHNNSSICSPERKRKCQDAGVQTSPGRMQSLIQDILKDIWGIEAEQKLAVICQGSNRKLHFDQDNLQSTTANFQDKSCGKDDVKSTLSQTMTQNANSQDFVKQNARNSTENLSYSKKCLNDSDFVLGTENIDFSLGNILNKHCNRDALEIGNAIDSSSILKEKSLLPNNDVEVDPDAPTQPYKTPVVPKRPFVTSTSNLYSAVSNPSESELKRVNEIFENNDVLFPDATPKATPWNCSGISQLECYTTNLNKQLNSISHSPLKASKEKSNKSRRQLDFVIDDNTNSNDLFNAENSEEMSRKTEPKFTKDSQNWNTHKGEIISIIHDSKESPCISMNKENIYDNITENVLLNSNSIILVEDDKFFNNKPRTDTAKLDGDQVISSQMNDLRKCNETLTETPDIIFPTEEQESSSNTKLSVTRGQVNPIYKNILRDDLQKYVLSSPTEKSNEEEEQESNIKDSNVGISTCSLGHLVKHQDTSSLQKAIISKDPKKENNDGIITFQSIGCNELQYDNSLVACNKSESTVDVQRYQDEEQTLKPNSHMVDDGPMCSNEVSNPSSEDLFVEGTPSQTKTHVNYNLQNESDILQEPNKGDSTNLSEKFSEKAAHSVTNKFEQHFGTESTKMEHEHTQQATTRTENTQNKNCNQSETVESSQCETENYCFSSSLLTSHQNQILGYLLANLNIQFSKTVGKHISHLIVSNSGGYAKHSHKFLLAMALHKPIIKYDWIEQVIKMRRVVPLEDYLAVDHNGVCGVLRAKEDVKRELLKNFAIHIYNTVDNEVQRDQIEEIITLCGGTVVADLHQFSAVSRSLTRVILLSKHLEANSEGEELLKCRDMYKAPLVAVTWLYDTISQYRVLPLLEYIADAINLFLTDSHQEDVTGQEQSFRC